MVALHDSYINAMETCVWVFSMVTLCCAADISYMNATIRDHFSSIRHHETNFAYKEMARAFIYEEFRRFGLHTEFHNFTTTDNTKGLQMGSNIIGILQGKRFGTFKDRIAGIGAHYDTVRNSPGVDDNGSGLVAMLEVAKRARALDRHNTAIFVSFDLEEEDYKGSRQFVEEWLPQFLVTNYNADPSSYADQIKLHGFYVLDSIMNYNTTAHSQTFPPSLTVDKVRTVFSKFYNDLVADKFQGDYINSIYRKDEDQFLNKALSQAWQSLSDPVYQMENLQIPISDLNRISESDFREFLRSDHASFWGKSIPALFLTDSGNYRGDMINCYHQPCDNMNVMLTEDNLKFLGKQADALYLSLHFLEETGMDSLHAGRGRPCFLLIMIAMILVMLV
ncbi:hypothetical protein CHS0354_014409 [Potamilus streckersoni]|uniref:Peptidase M28 domain-containing protein n=1 Tax=Potamilus streckersoni TaxID=2493646 RepID=A0AAE0VSU4_9BIVA|nr:hypothetical protein CHS0354_014409 [Potamilus streckersoni]